ncbi:MAG: hypothetical protein DMG56_26415 [Acidobacteria bacterium]|nr:MAG: hypothetical protein DMG56_26415 [Acidobacteriota bacterium]PYU54830.1 MAG: hypothetical protein DMG55_30205 [Acidobacteriota bacterium]
MEHANAHRLQTGLPIRHSRGAMVLEGSLSHFPTCLTIQELTPKRGSFPLKEKSNCQKSHFPLILEM